MARWSLPASLLVAVATAIGRLRQGTSARRVPAFEANWSNCRQQLDQAQRENADLQDRLTQSQQQVQGLQQFGPRQLELVPHAVAIRVGRYTSAVDTDGAPGDDAVKVTVLPVDPQGHITKVAGSLLVELYDLQAPGGPEPSWPLPRRTARVGQAVGQRPADQLLQPGLPVGPPCRALVDHGPRGIHRPGHRPDVPAAESDRSQGG